MTVGELKKLLEQFDDDIPICIPTKLSDHVCKLFDFAGVDAAVPVQTESDKILVLDSDDVDYE